MAPYYPVFISRSDGRLETTSLRTKKKEANAPAEALLNANREVNGNRDYYKAIEVGDAKEVDWRRKIGSMLMKEIGDKEHTAQRYILGAMPENYRLYEHVKIMGHEVTGQLKKLKGFLR